MNKTIFSKTLSLIMCIMLIAAMALIYTGCSEQKSTSSVSSESSVEKQTLGEGANSFILSVVDTEKNEKQYEIHTDKTNLCDVLVELGIIEVGPSKFGKLVNAVNGVALDYDKDGKYWAIYIADQYATSSIDEITIENGKTYALKAE